MTTPEREWKRLRRLIRYIPVDEIAPSVSAYETDGMWCIIDGELSFVPADGGTCEMSLCDMEQVAILHRYIASKPERVHASIDSARRFVSSKFRQSSLPESA